MDQLDAYTILNLAPTASDEEIKRAYRKLSLQYHPDRLTEANREQGHAQFAQISEAHRVLSDPELRKLYDRGGWDLVKAHQNHQQQEAMEACPPLIFMVTVDLEQIMAQPAQKLTISRRLRDGVIIARQMVMTPLGPMMSGDGSEISPHESQGFTNLDKVFSLDIELQPQLLLAKGINVQHQGLEQPDKVNGDIIVRFELSESCPFHLEGRDLCYTAKLGLSELIHGYRLIVPYPKGAFRLTGRYQPPRVEQAEDQGAYINILRLPGLGLPVGRPGIRGGVGMLIIKLIPDLNWEISEDLKAAIPVECEVDDQDALPDYSNRALTNLPQTGNQVSFGSNVGCPVQ